MKSKKPSKEHFAMLKKKIQKENEKAKCWKCKHFRGFYYDGVTFDCAVTGDNSMWGCDELNCRKFIEAKEGKK